MYLLACQARLKSLRDIEDVLEMVPKEIVGRVKTRLVSQCVELCNQPAVIDWALKQHWAEIAISLLNEDPCILGR